MIHASKSLRYAQSSAEWLFGFRCQSRHTLKGMDKLSGGSLSLCHTTRRNTTSLSQCFATFPFWEPKLWITGPNLLHGCIASALSQMSQKEKKHECEQRRIKSSKDPLVAALDATTASRHFYYPLRIFEFCSLFLQLFEEIWIAPGSGHGFPSPLAFRTSAALESAAVW